jgi:hypothetical protein
MNMSDVVKCPRCGGTWWFSRVFHEIPLKMPRPNYIAMTGEAFIPERPDHEEIVSGIPEGRETPYGLHAFSRGRRVLYFCGQCSFPGIEPKEGGVSEQNVTLVRK